MHSISIIIPSFNRRDLLPQTLESLFHQSLKATEIIVVDDHSTDGTVEFLRAHYSNKVTVILNKGKGPGAARNTGLGHATGDFIKFFDSDDLMTSNSLEVQYKALKTSERQFIYSPYFRAWQRTEGSWEAEDNVIMHYYAFHKALPLWHFMVEEGLFIAIPGMLFRRSLLDEAGPWREDATAYEDWDYLFRLSLLEPYPLHTNECAFIYRMHGTQTTMGNFSDEQRDQDKTKVLENLYEQISGDTRFNTITKAFFENKFYQLYRDTPSISLKDKLKQYDTLFQRILWQYMRMKLKIGRSKTGTAWQPAHGPHRSAPAVSRYLDQIKA